SASCTTRARGSVPEQIHPHARGSEISGPSTQRQGWDTSPRPLCRELDRGGNRMRARFVRTVTLLVCYSLGVRSLAQQQTGGAAASAALTLAPPSAPPQITKLDKDLDARVGALVPVVAKKGPFSGVVAVARDGKIVAARVGGS